MYSFPPRSIGDFCMGVRLCTDSNIRVHFFSWCCVTIVAVIWPLQVYWGNTSSKTRTSIVILRRVPSTLWMGCNHILIFPAMFHLHSLFSCFIVYAVLQYIVLWFFSIARVSSVRCKLDHIMILFFVTSLRFIVIYISTGFLLQCMILWKKENFPNQLIRCSWIGSILHCVHSIYIVWCDDY